MRIVLPEHGPERQERLVHALRVSLDSRQPLGYPVHNWTALRGLRDSQSLRTATLDMAKKLTGLVCPACGKPIAKVGDVGPNGVSLACPGCGHHYYARDRPKD